MSERILTIRATKKAGQHCVLMHPARCCPAVEPGLYYHESVRRTKMEKKGISQFQKNGAVAKADMIFRSMEIV